MSLALRARQSAQWCSLLLLASAACASTGSPAARVQPEPAADVSTLAARLPAHIGVFEQFAHEGIRGSDTDIIYRYRDGSKTVLSVILYPVKAGENGAATDAAGSVRQEGLLFGQVLAYQASHGMIESSRLLSQRDDSIAVGASWIPTHVTVATTTRRGAMSYEIQYLHAIRGDFVKMRVTVPESLWPRNDLAAFDSALVVALAAH